MNPRSSIYTIGREIASDNPLRRFFADGERGWAVARNLKKPLQHLPVLKDKELIAKKLNLHNVESDPETFARNYSLAEAFQRGEIQLQKVLSGLITDISPEQTERLLASYAESTHLEFHPTDLCNLRCTGCTYKNDDPASSEQRESFEFSSLQRLALLKPKSMVIIGGGEPTLYRNGTKHFRDLILEIKRHVPEIKFGLISNGTFKPPCDSELNHLSWVRISLDASSEETFKRVRSSDGFPAVIKNLLAYLRLDVPHVGVSFTYSKANIQEYAEVIRYLYFLVKTEMPDRISRLNIQYRPFLDSDNLFEDPHKEGPVPPNYVDDKDIEKTTEALCALADRYPEIEPFIRNQTNATAILAGNTYPLYSFTRCFYSQIFKLIRANGNLYPCFMRALGGEDFLLGNIKDSPLAAIGLNSLVIGTSSGNNCHTWTCRSSHINRTLEMGLNGELSPSTSPEVLRDPMF